MNLDERIDYLSKKFTDTFKEKPEDVFVSPGRIELCGNHTDHNNGKVLVASIDLNIIAVTSKSNDNKVTFISEGFPEMNVDLNDLELKESEFGTSKALIKGVLAKMRQKGYKIESFKVYSNSTIYKGAGVSSSAAFEVLIAKIVSYYFNDDKIDPFTLAQISQFAESVYFNKPCGLLDQSGIALGGINYIDFKDTSHPIIHNLKIDIPDYQFILINTGDDHSKLTDCYASIKKDMKKVANFFHKDVLREVDEISFAVNANQVEKECGLQAKERAEHYFNENKRVQEAYDELLLNNNVEALFKAMDESGLSSFYKLKNCYVSDMTEKLPSALKYCRNIPNVICSRVHGGGFAGTMIMVVKKNDVDQILPLLIEKFSKENVMLVNITKNGTHHYKTIKE